MFRTLARLLLPNPLDARLKKRPKNVLVCWNRGLGDIALGLYAIVHRIRTLSPEAKITFLVRENLADGMSMLDGVKTIVAPGWKRGEPYALPNIEGFDLVLEHPSPSDWCRWQYGKLTPKLRWDKQHDDLWQRFALPDGFTYVGVQAVAETNYGLWRNWPEARWRELFDQWAQLGNVRVLLFGYGTVPKFDHPMIMDLRGKTTLFELLSIIKHRCTALVLPDSGILSMTYYLDETFPLRVVSLWADPRHGILKQNVPSPNPALVHIPLVGALRDASTITAAQVNQACFPTNIRTPLRHCARHTDVAAQPLRDAAAVILAGGQGSRLKTPGPKGLFLLGGKTLFQHLIEKLPLSMPAAVMTSPLNHDETVRYFQQHNFFGRNIRFFMQDTLPLLDANYHEVGHGPDGNGGVYKKLVESGILDAWEQQNIDTVLIVPVENVLADPADKTLVTYHREQQADVTIKCIERNPSESMGLLVENHGHLGVAEYITLTEQPTSPSYSYTGQLAVSTSFIRRASQFDPPLHWVKKYIPLHGHELPIWKRERFLFDAFHLAKKTSALCFPREMCYAPVKGPDSVAVAEQAAKKVSS